MPIPLERARRERTSADEMRDSEHPVRPAGPLIGVCRPLRGVLRPVRRVQDAAPPEASASGLFAMTGLASPNSANRCAWFFASPR